MSVSKRKFQTPHSSLDASSLPVASYPSSTQFAPLTIHHTLHPSSTHHPTPFIFPPHVLFTHMHVYTYISGVVQAREGQAGKTLHMHDASYRQLLFLFTTILFLLYTI